MDFTVLVYVILSESSFAYKSDSESFAQLNAAISGNSLHNLQIFSIFQDLKLQNIYTYYKVSIKNLIFKKNIS